MEKSEIELSQSKDSNKVDVHALEASHSAAELEGTSMKSIYRKLDRRIIPGLWALYFMVSLVGNSYGLTLTMNTEQGHSIIQTLDLTSRDISTASALDYVGFIIFDVPMNLIMTKVSPHLWLCRIVISIGVVYCCYAALNNAAGLIAIRFFSGVAGSGFWPGMTLYLSYFYPTEMHTKRIGYYFTAAQISTAVAGLINAGFQKMDGLHGYYGWQWMYIICGAITVFVGIVSLWWLPDKPRDPERQSEEKSGLYGSLSTGYDKVFPAGQPLTQQEQEIHYHDVHHTKLNWGWKDVVAILCDIRIWPLILMYFGAVGVGYGLAVFGTTIIKTNNPSLTSIQVSLLYAPIWLFDAGGILTMTPLSDMFKKYRYLVFSSACLIIIVGMLVTTYAHGPWSKYGGLLIAGYGLGATVPTCMSLSAEIFGAEYGEVGVAAAAALTSGLGNLGSVTATYALYSGWPEDKARLYQYSNMILVLMMGISIIAAFVLQAIKHKKRLW